MREDMISDLIDLVFSYIFFFFLFKIFFFT